MKHKPITLLLILLLFIVFYGCEKHPFDYRNKFIGDYDFLVNLRTWIPPDSVTETDYNYSGKISYGSGDDFVKINFLDDKEVDCRLFEDGSLKVNSIRGEFESTKKLRFITEYGGLGGKATYYVSGKKTK